MADSLSLLMFRSSRHIALLFLALPEVTQKDGRFPYTQTGASLNAYAFAEQLVHQHCVSVEIQLFTVICVEHFNRMNIVENLIEQYTVN